MSSLGGSVRNRAGRVQHYIRNGRLDYFRYAVWVRLYRLDFRPVSLEDLGFNRGEAEHHTASGGVFLADVLNKLEIRVGSRVLDLGCGKGSALCTLANFPFAEVSGVELSPDLAATARRNVQRLSLDQVNVTVADAAEFTDLDRYTHLYMFNPFPAEVMVSVMNNLAESLRRAPRTLTVIYFFPVCDQVLIDSGLFDEQQDLNVGATHPYRIYTHKFTGGN